MKKKTEQQIEITSNNSPLKKKTKEIEIPQKSKETSPPSSRKKVRSLWMFHGKKESVKIHMESNHYFKDYYYIDLKNPVAPTRR